MGVNSLPKTVSRQRRGCDLSPGPSAPVSSTLTTRLLSHPSVRYNSNAASGYQSKFSVWCVHCLFVRHGGGGVLKERLDVSDRPKNWRDAATADAARRNILIACSLSRDLLTCIASWSRDLWWLRDFTRSVWRSRDLTCIARGHCRMPRQFCLLFSPW